MPLHPCILDTRIPCELRLVWYTGDFDYSPWLITMPDDIPWLTRTHGRNTPHETENISLSPE